MNLGQINKGTGRLEEKLFTIGAASDLSSFFIKSGQKTTKRQDDKEINIECSS